MTNDDDWITIRFLSFAQSVRDLTSSVFQSPSSYLYHLTKPSSVLVRWHMTQLSSMHVRNSRNREAFWRIVTSISLTILLCWGAGRASIRTQCDILSTSKFCKLSRMRTRTSVKSIEHRRLKTLKFGRNAARDEAKKTSHGPIILSSLKFLQWVEISSKIYGGFAILGIVRDSNSFQQRMALHIPVFLILFQAGRTSRLSRGHLANGHY